MLMHNELCVTTLVHMCQRYGCAWNRVHAKVQPLKSVVKAATSKLFRARIKLKSDFSDIKFQVLSIKSDDFHASEPKTLLSKMHFSSSDVVRRILVRMTLCSKETCSNDILFEKIFCLKETCSKKKHFVWKKLVRMTLCSKILVRKTFCLKETCSKYILFEENLFERHFLWRKLVRKTVCLKETRSKDILFDDFRTFPYS
jgi:hypothetical protein